MLKKFSVKNFKQFKALDIDFSDVRNYDFSKDCLTKHKHPLIKTAVIYGPNASGKSNFGFAIFDIVQHLVDKLSQPEAYNYYLNADAPEKPAEFEYTFLLNGKEVIYRYAKINYKTLISEELVVNDALVFFWNKENHFQDFSGLKKFGLERLNWTQKDAQISYLRFIANNSVLKQTSPIRQLVEFVNSMLWFRRVDKNNNFIGFQSAASNIDEFIINNNLVEEFIEFLHDNQVHENVVVERNPDGRLKLYFKHSRLLPFFDVASSGTIALTVYFYWKHYIKDVGFLFMDEYDAFYHFEIARNILEQAKKFHCQTILTTHNTSLLTHELVRPDVCFLIRDGVLKSFSNLTERELREGNNLEKLYVSGEFNG